jgi:hypothetical protein
MAILRNVAKTDTLEIQRQKINLIANDIFNIGSGGSDLSTGNLKLGDGTRTEPSLAFVSDPSLGIYKPRQKTFGFVSSGKKIADYSETAVYTFKDLIIQQNILTNAGISLLDKGSNYDAGTYTDIPLVGGTGDGATADITVTEFGGEIIDSGSNYNEGNYSNISLVGGNGSGAVVSFSVEGIEGDISNPGSGYVPGTYNNVSLTGGTGTGATANITITGETILSGSISSSGSGYAQGSYSFVQLVNKPVQTFVVTTITNPGTPPPNNVYVIDGDTQKQLTLIKGNTYRFDLSDSSNANHPLVVRSLSNQFLPETQYIVVQKGTAGQAGSFVDLIIKPSAPTETIKYNCLIHDGMGANISVINGTPGFYGSNAFANITVNSSGQISNVQITTIGLDYKANDILQVYRGEVGNTGSGFEFTLAAPSYTGQITGVDIQSSGQNYILNDVLSANTSNLGGSGSGFSFTINNNPKTISNLIFSSKGSGYEVGDVIELPKTITNVSANLKGQVTNVSTTLSDSSAVITVADTTGIVPGMSVFGTFGDTGILTQGTTVTSVDSLTQITLSQIPSTAGAAVLTFTFIGNLGEVAVSSLSGIVVNSVVTQTSGTGILAPNTIVTSINPQTNLIVVSPQPLQAGTAVLSFVPPYGDPVDDFEYEILNLGEIETYSITAGGNGYSLLDELTVNPTDLTQPINYTVINRSVATITFVDDIPTSTFSVGDFLKKRDGGVISFVQTTAPSVSQTVISNISTTLSSSSNIISVSSTTGILAGMLVSQDTQNDIGILAPGTSVLSVDSSTQITLSVPPNTSGAANLTFSSNESGTYQNVSSLSSGDGVGATFNVTRNTSGSILSVELNNPGYFYEETDTITISGDDIGGSSPDEDIVLTVFTTTSTENLEIFDIKDDGTNITSMLISFDVINSGDFLITPDTLTPQFEIDTSSSIQYRYYIDTGNGLELTPSWDVYVGDSYRFDLSDNSNASHRFALSVYRDGFWGPSLIENISAVFSTTSTQITVANSTGILPGMSVLVTDGVGSLVGGTIVESISGNTITLSNAPLNAGVATVTFQGVEYTDGVTRTETSLTIRVTENTPNLYYFCATQNVAHVDEGGEDNAEALITVDSNNPKVFGSDFALSVGQLNTTDIITANIQTGNISAVSYTGSSAQLTSASITGTLTAPTITSNNITATTITSSSNLVLTGQAVNINGNFNVGSNVQVVNSNGNITTSGVLRTNNSLNVNNILTITNNTISTSSGNNIVLSPPLGRVAKINSTTALTIPTGTSAQRPGGSVVENGAIRFNTDTSQYEGYSAATTSWSSLGGVRDLDGNTYIAAEAFTGANDNTLYFFNDNNNTLRLNTNYLDFGTVKRIRSANNGAPTTITWTANTPVSLGQYVKFRNNIYEVTTAGVTGGVQAPPTHTTGAETNGTAVLTYFTTAVDNLIFEEINELQVGPLGNLPLVINAELRLANNVISTDVEDLVLRPNSGRKLTIDAQTSLVIPTGDSNNRGNPSQGSIRYNTTLSSFEGYSGTNWTSLGGVKDVDGNTYIIPETVPGANENILYFFNDGENTLQLSKTALNFQSISRITSTSDTLEINAELVSFDSFAASINNAGTTTFLSSTKTNLDLGLSVGLVNSHLLRLNSSGDIIVNKGFGTLSPQNIKVLDNELKDFELDDVKVSSSDLFLVKGTNNTGSSVIYSPVNSSGAKIVISAHNTTTNDKEFVEYSVCDKGNNIYNTEYGNITTGVNLFGITFDFDNQDNVRITAELSNEVEEDEQVNITIVKTIIKK